MCGKSGIPEEEWYILSLLSAFLVEELYASAPPKVHLLQS